MPNDRHQNTTGSEPTVPVDTDILIENPALAISSSHAGTDDIDDAGDVSAVATKFDPVAEGKSASRVALWKRVLAYGILPGLALILALGAGYLKWYDSSFRESQVAGVSSVTAAKDGAVALLSYRPDTVEKDLAGARDRLTGSFRDSYWQLVHDVVIPGAKQKQIAAAATVPAAASMTANNIHAVVLVLVDQTITIGNDAPTDTASSVRVTLEKMNDRWLISGFDPV